MARLPDLVNFDRVLPNGARDTVLILPAAVQALAASPDGHTDVILHGKQVRVVEAPHAAAELLGLTVTGSLARATEDAS